MKIYYILVPEERSLQCKGIYYVARECKAESVDRQCYQGLTIGNRKRTLGMLEVSVFQSALRLSFQRFLNWGN